MVLFSAKVLYAKHVARKRKTWQDGFLCVNEDQSKRSATLYDESGVVVANARVPSSQILNAESEDVSVFEGWIVTMDSVCHATDIPSAARGSTEGSTVAAYTTTDKPAQCTARGQVVKFHAPRATRKLMPLNCITASASTGSRHALCHLNPDPTPQQNCLEPSKTASTAERVGPIHSAAKRSDDDILRLLISPRKVPGPEDPHSKGCGPTQAAAVCNSPAQPAIKQRQPPQACNHVSKAAGQRLPLPHPSSAWEQFIDAEAETSQAEAEADSSQKSLTQSHVTGVMCRHGLQSQSLAVSGPVSKVLQQAQHGTSRCGSLPQAEPTYTIGSQQSHAGAQPSNEEHKPNTTPAATPCKPLVPIFSKHKQHVFKPPAMMPADHGNSQCKAPSQQTSSSVQAAQDASNKPAIVFDELHAMARCIAVPTSFASLRSYQQTWCDAVTEEVNIRLACLAKEFHAAMQQISVGMQKGGVAAQLRPAPTEMEKGLRLRRLAYYSQCELVVYQQHRGAARSFTKGRSKGRFRKGHNEGSSDDEEGNQKGAASVFLQIRSGQEKPSAYQRDDIWVLSSHAAFQGAQQSGANGRSAQGWLLLARSLWHGPNKDGRMQIELLAGVPSQLQRKQAVYAIRGPNAATELAMFATLQALSPAALPCLPALLSQRDSSSKTLAAGTETGPMDDCALRIAAEFRLNNEQRSVLQHCSLWAASDKAVSPICIVHGPFGCGKSSLLVALVHYLLTQRSQAGSALKGCRVLLSAHTNIAVDRLMTGLMDTGCSDMVRVGALRRISKSLLPHSLHAVDSKAKSDAVGELKDMLTGCTTVTEAALIHRELDQLKQGPDRQRKKKLKSAAVVGVTCCSAGLLVLEGQSFDVCLLDEATQMVEPLTLNPLSTAKPRFIIMAGDPCQLPPVVAAPAAVTPCPAAVASASAATGPAPAAAGPVTPALGPAAAAMEPAATAVGSDAASPLQQPSQQSLAGVRNPATGVGLQGLARPLLVRLTQMGHKAHLLRTQYRCHPEISRVSNTLFYNGRLLDGCSPAQRPALAPGLAPVCFLETQGGYQQYQKGSSSASNKAEAQAVVQAIKQLSASGVANSSIGVICFFRAQVALIQKMLQPGTSTPAPAAAPGEAVVNDADAAGQPPNQDASQDVVQVATVDSFQGMEKDVILLATTITHAGAFATDAQRVNVALTRAKHHLVVLGSSQVLRSSSAAFRLLLSSCQMLPAGACLVLPSSLSNKSKLSSSSGISSACVAEELDHDNEEKHESDIVPAQHHGSVITREQAWAFACSDVSDDLQLSDPAQKARGLDKRSAAASKDLSPPGEVRDVCLALRCPNQAVVKHLKQAVPSVNATQVAAPDLTL